jgi:hypothetical protein
VQKHYKKEDSMAPRKKKIELISSGNYGIVSQVIGAVVDVYFEKQLHDRKYLVNSPINYTV